MFFKCLYLTRIGSPDILWSVNKLARSVTKWTRACDKRLARLISYIHHTVTTSNVVLWVTRLSIDDRAHSKTQTLLRFGRFTMNLGWNLMYLGKRTFVPICWMCKKQTSVSHGSTASEIISLDAGLIMDGLLALDLWDVVKEVLRSSNSTKSPKTKPATGNCLRDPERDRTSKPNRRETEMLINCRIRITLLQTHTLLKVSLSCTFLRITKLWSRWSLRAEVQQWDTCQEPTELRLSCYFTESIWTSKSTSNMLTPKTNSRTCWQKVVLHVMNWTILFDCWTLWISRCFPAFFLSNRKQSIMSKRFQESTAKEGLAVAKPRPMSLVSRNLLSAK